MSPTRRDLIKCSALAITTAGMPSDAPESRLILQPAFAINGYMRLVDWSGDEIGDEHFRTLRMVRDDAGAWTMRTARYDDADVQWIASRDMSTDVFLDRLVYALTGRAA